MGIVFSCLASTFMLLGELTSTLFLAVGEVGSLLARGLFGLIVGLCDVLAACMCCCQVPFSERPDRDGYTYTTLSVRNAVVNKTKFSNASFAAIPKSASKSEVKETAESEIGSEGGAVEEEKKEAQDKAALKLNAAKEKKAKKLVASEEKKKKKEELVAAKLAKKEAKKSKGQLEEVKTEEAVAAPLESVDDPAAEPVAAPAPGWFSGWFSAAPATSTATTTETPATAEVKA